MGEFFASVGDGLATLGGGDGASSSLFNMLAGANKANNMLSSNPSNTSQLQDANELMKRYFAMQMQQPKVNSTYQLNNPLMTPTTQQQYTWLPNATQDKYSKYLNGFGG